MPLTQAQLSGVRQLVQKSSAPCDKTKTTINDAINALDAYYEATAKAGFASAIETAAPLQFTNSQKVQLAKYWLLTKAGLV